MVYILSWVKSGDQVKLEVTADDLLHFGEMLIKQTRKECEEERALAREEEPEEKFLSTAEVCKIFNECLKLRRTTLHTCSDTSDISHRALKVSNGI